jgi:hypothetical protein
VAVKPKAPGRVALGLNNYLPPGAKAQAGSESTEV